MTTDEREATRLQMLGASASDDPLLAGIAKGWLALEDARLALRAQHAEANFNHEQVEAYAQRVRAELTEAIFALQAAWPYVHDHCTIKSKRDEVQAVLVKHGDFADLAPARPPLGTEALMKATPISGWGVQSIGLGTGGSGS